MRASVEIRDARGSDVEVVQASFGDWPKPPSLFAHYLAAAESRRADFLTAWVGEEVAGYVLVEWRSTYSPFAEAGIPEIKDLSVLPAYRRAGVGSRLLDEAEARIAQRADTAGLRVGLYGDYGAAQRLYALRGYVTDGAGILSDGRPVPPGTTIVVDDEVELGLTKRLSFNVGDASPAMRALVPATDEFVWTVDGASLTEGKLHDVTIRSTRGGQGPRIAVRTMLRMPERIDDDGSIHGVLTDRNSVASTAVVSLLLERTAAEADSGRRKEIMRFALERGQNLANDRRAWSPTPLHVDGGIHPLWGTEIEEGYIGVADLGTAAVAVWADGLPPGISFTWAHIGSPDLPPVGRPATSALHLAGISTMFQVAKHTRAELAALHGVGPKALRLLEEALEERRLGWAERSRGDAGRDRDA
ncbi:MAG TPA: N-acetyltransferase [Naasia sp.]